MRRCSGSPGSILGSGFAGDPRYVGWLINHMKDEKLARLAGEAFSLITGADLTALNLRYSRPEDLETGPNDDPEDANVDVDPDEGLPLAGRCQGRDVVAHSIASLPDWRPLLHGQSAESGCLSARLAGGVSASANRGRVALVALECGNTALRMACPRTAAAAPACFDELRYPGGKIHSYRPGCGDDDTAWPKNDLRSLIAARALATIGTLPGADCLPHPCPCCCGRSRSTSCRYSADLCPLRSARRLDRPRRQQHARAARSRASHLAPRRRRGLRHQERRQCQSDHRARAASSRWPSASRRRSSRATRCASAAICS